MSFGERHPSPEQLEAVAFGWVPAEEAHRIRDHAARCPTCGPLLAADVEIRARLALLRADEPLVNVVPQVLQRIAVEQPVSLWAKVHQRFTAKVHQRFAAKVHQAFTAKVHHGAR